jgi:plastocyanin
VKRFLLPLLLLPTLVLAQDGNRTIVQKNRRFTPSQISIPRGASLTFTNEDDFIHQMYVEGLFDSDEKRPGENLTEVFPNAGTFEVKCHIHPKMKLVVRVN